VKSSEKQVAIIGTVGIPARYGGFETLAEYLTKKLAQRYRLTVFCSTKGLREKPGSYNGATLRYIDLGANGVQSIPYDIVSTVKALTFADTLLILGVSGCIVLPFVKLVSKKRIIVNIDGLEWKRAKWNGPAKRFLKFSEKMAVKYADAVISDNKVIQDYVQEEYGKRSELIAYGADHVRKLPLTDEVRETYPFLGNPYAFSVCRIEPENNVHMILEAFAEQGTHPLVFIGNWKRSAYGRELKEKYADAGNLHLLEPVYDQELLDRFRGNCRVYVHGHSAGGTNPSLVEAIQLGLPVFAFDVAYNKETTEYKAFYFASADELVKLIGTADDEKLAGISASMADVASRRYSWDVIADAYAALF